MTPISLAAEGDNGLSRYPSVLRIGPGRQVSSQQQRLFIR